MKKKSSYREVIFSIKYLLLILVVIIVASLLMIFDNFITIGKNLEYSVYLYEEMGINLPYASLNFETDFTHFIPLYLYKNRIDDNFFFKNFNIVKKSQNIWLSIKVTSDQVEGNVLMIYTDNAFLKSAYIINKNNKNILKKSDYNSVLLKNTNRKIVLDVASKLNEKEYNLYLQFAGDPGNIRVFTYDKNNFVKLQELLFLLVGIWLGILLIVISNISRILEKKDNRKLIAYIFIVIYILSYFGILIVRTGFFSIHSLHLNYIETIIMVLSGGVAFCVLKLLISSRMNKEWLHSSLLLISIFMLLIFSGYLFIAEILSTTFIMILFLVVLYYNNTFKYTTEIAKKYGFVVQITSIVFLFVNILESLFNKNFSFNHRFLHYGILLSILLLILKNYEWVHYKKIMISANNIEEKLSEKYDQLEKELHQRLKIIRGLLCKPVSEIMVMLDDIVGSTNEENIKKFAKIWKIELGHYLPYTEMYAVLDKVKNREYINLARLLYNANSYLKYYDCNIKVNDIKVINIDVLVDQEIVEWLFVKAILFVYTISGSSDVTVSVIESKPYVIINISAENIKNYSSLENTENRKIYEEELLALSKFAELEIDIYIEEKIINISIKILQSFDAASTDTYTQDKIDYAFNQKTDMKNKNTKVLIVEDEPIILYALKRNLEKMGYTVQAVVSGHRGLDYLKNYGDAKIILLSDSLLDMDWHEFIEEIFEIMKKRIPIIVITSITKHDNIDTVFKAGADDFITKPINIYELIARIKMHIQINESIENQLENQQRISELDKLKSLAWLTAGIAHEINTPNNAVLRNVPIIRAVGERLLQEVDKIGFNQDELFSGGFTYIEVKNEFPKMLNDIYMSAIQISKIIDDLRLYVRTGNTQMLKPININGVVEYALRLLNHTIKNGTYNFVLELGQDIPNINGDAMKIVQILVNLIENAIHSLPDKSKKILVKTYAEKVNNQSCVVLIVEDEGCGIKDDILPFIFDPFFTTRREMGGTGLGLPVVYGIVKEHNAEIHVETKKDIGTKFKILFPALIEEGV
ncbi:MAG TPA: ATP-binding protein [Spirochaetia bacterium]|nr:ATP-binding protein [Spirochaetia bacterium]